MQGIGEKVWLRKIAKPDNCQGIRKVYHGYRVRLVLTEEGDIFVSGNSKEIRGFNVNQYIKGNQDPDYSDMFKQLEPHKIFEGELGENEKIIDVTVNRVSQFDDDFDEERDELLPLPSKMGMIAVTDSGRVIAKGFILQERFKKAEKGADTNTAF